MTFSLTRLAASRYRPSVSRRLTSGSAARASGFTGSYGRPAHSVSSLSCSRSCTTPPNTIAPRRPLPTGSARTHSWFAPRPLAPGGSNGRSDAGARYHRLSCDGGGCAAPVSRGAGGCCAENTSTPKTADAASHAAVMYRILYFFAAASASAFDLWPASSHLRQFASFARQPPSAGLYQVPSFVTIRPIAPPDRPSCSGQWIIVMRSPGLKVRPSTFGVRPMIAGGAAPSNPQTVPLASLRYSTVCGLVNVQRTTSPTSTSSRLLSNMLRL